MPLASVNITYNFTCKYQFSVQRINFNDHSAAIAAAAAAATYILHLLCSAGGGVHLLVI